MGSLKGIPPRNCVFVYLCKHKMYLDLLVSCGWPSAPNSEKFATGYKSYLDTQQGILKCKKTIIIIKDYIEIYMLSSSKEP